MRRCLSLLSGCDVSVLKFCCELLTDLMEMLRTYLRQSRLELRCDIVSLWPKFCTWKKDWE